MLRLVASSSTSASITRRRLQHRQIIPGLGEGNLIILIAVRGSLDDAFMLSMFYVNSTRDQINRLDGNIFFARRTLSSLTTFPLNPRSFDPNRNEVTP